MNNVKDIRTTTTPLGPSTALNQQIIVDTGCTGHFLAVSAPYKNKKKTMNGISVLLPNKDTMIATHTAELDLPNLPVEARTAHNTSLLSVGQLCDAQCTATFTSTDVTITHNNKTVLHGIQTKPDNLWHANFPQTPTETNSKPWILVENKKQQKKITTQKANNINQTQKAAELVAFAHRSFFSPAISTLQQALTKNYINHVPGLTVTTLRNHPPHSVATIKGHLDQSRKINDRQN